MSNLEKLSFCLSEQENEALEALRRRLAVQAGLFNRSEVMRIALAYLAEQGDAEIANAASTTTRFKPGRRRKGSGLGSEAPAR